LRWSSCCRANRSYSRLDERGELIGNRAERATIQKLAVTSAEQSESARAVFDEQIGELRGQVDKSAKDAEEVRRIAS